MMLTWRTSAPSGWRRLLRLALPTAEPIELSARRFGFLPARFHHHGALYRIAQVERIWERRGSGTEPDRRYFMVRCADSRRCTLSHDLRAGAWHVHW